MQYDDMKPMAETVADLMKTLAHPNRLLALCAMMEKERSVGELAEALGMRDQAMSQQLAILRNKGLVTTRRNGQTIYYGLADARIATVMSALYATYCAPEDGAAA
ncbi:ArsR/SmtB family transcription factor [Maricaulis maris]|uniref:ArsR family transcriptional regulator n=1 Tax=Maricaulis maris TaxID=74318 RepID=A0A495DK24_9PROT|nr:metalloregulator ArsR/SmtB family transcription factor [Maricaulis maris]RKR02973.1 ArsR family transcriptional regulator [Maricaulis maris]